MAFSIAAAVSGEDGDFVQCREHSRDQTHPDMQRTPAVPKARVGQGLGMEPRRPHSSAVRMQWQEVTSVAAFQE